MADKPKPREPKVLWSTSPLDGRKGHKVREVWRDANGQWWTRDRDLNAMTYGDWETRG